MNNPVFSSTVSSNTVNAPRTPRTNRGPRMPRTEPRAANAANRTAGRELRENSRIVRRSSGSVPRLRSLRFVEQKTQHRHWPSRAEARQCTNKFALFSRNSRPAVAVPYSRTVLDGDRARRPELSLGGSRGEFVEEHPPSRRVLTHRTWFACARDERRVPGESVIIIGQFCAVSLERTSISKSMFMLGTQQTRRRTTGSPPRFTRQIASGAR